MGLKFALTQPLSNTLDTKAGFLIKHFAGVVTYFGMPLGAFLLVRVLYSFNALLTSTTQVITTRWWLYTSYVGGILDGDVEKVGGIPSL